MTVGELAISLISYNPLYSRPVSHLGSTAELVLVVRAVGEPPEDVRTGELAGRPADSTPGL